EAFARASANGSVRRREVGLVTEQTVSEQQLAQTAALGDLGRLVEDHGVRLLAQDALQQLGKAHLGLSAWLARVTDDPSNTAEPQPLHLDHVAVEQRRTARGGFPRMAVGWSRLDGKTT